MRVGGPGRARLGDGLIGAGGVTGVASEGDATTLFFTFPTRWLPGHMVVASAGQSVIIDTLKDAARQHIGVALGVAVGRVGNQSEQQGAIVRRH